MHNLLKTVRSITCILFHIIVRAGSCKAGLHERTSNVFLLCFHYFSKPYYISFALVSPISGHIPLARESGEYYMSKLCSLVSW